MLLEQIASQLRNGAQVQGRLAFNYQGVVFKNTKTGKVTSLSPSNWERVSWIRLGAGYGIKLLLKDGNMHRFGLFKQTVRLNA